MISLLKLKFGRKVRNFMLELKLSISDKINYGEIFLCRSYMFLTKILKSYTSGGYLYLIMRVITWVKNGSYFSLNKV